MELGQTPRPRAAVPEYTDRTPRVPCSVCCGLRCAAVVGGVALLVTMPCSTLLLRGRVCDGRGWRGFCNVHLLTALPLSAITFTHQVILSESLWSRNKHSVWQINWQSSLTNMVLWVSATALCTMTSRKYAARWSRRYRLSLWEYRRRRRGCANAWLPTPFGRISDDLDWYNVLWCVSMYHLLWGFVTLTLERQSGAHYAMFFRDWPYSRWCAPRWREWRELEVMRHVHTEQVVVKDRWGSFLTNDRWKARRL